MEQKRYNPGDKVWVVDTMPEANDGYLRSAHGESEMCAMLGKQVTIRRVGEPQRPFGYEIVEETRHWWREDLLRSYPLFDEPDNIKIDYAMFEKLMAE